MVLCVLLSACGHQGLAPARSASTPLRTSPPLNVTGRPGFAPQPGQAPAGQATSTTPSTDDPVTATASTDDPLTATARTDERVTAIVTAAASETARVCSAARLHAKLVGVGLGGGLAIASIEVTATAGPPCRFGSRVRVGAVIGETEHEVGTTTSSNVQLTGTTGAASIGLRGFLRDYTAPQDRCSLGDYVTPSAWKLTWGDEVLVVPNRAEGVDITEMRACFFSFAIAQAVSDGSQ
jgi:hypothetical protein